MVVFLSLMVVVICLLITCFSCCQWWWLWLWFAANNLEVDALFVYTKAGHMASLLSRCRPDCPIFAFTSTTSVRRRLNLQWGLIPFRLSFSEDMESNLNRTFSLLKARGMIKSGDLVIAVSDMLQSIQVMNVPWRYSLLWFLLFKRRIIWVSVQVWNTVFVSVVWLDIINLVGAKESVILVCCNCLSLMIPDIVKILSWYSAMIIARQGLPGSHPFCSKEKAWDFGTSAWKDDSNPGSSEWVCTEVPL